MTRIIAVVSVVGGADDDRVTSSIHRHRPAGPIVCGFAVDIGTDLHPPTVSQREHPSLTRTIAVAVVAVGADDDRVTSSIHRHRIAGIIACGFAVDIGTDLHPPTVSQREHPSMTRIIAVAVVEAGADDDRVTSSIHRHRQAGLIACGFAVDIGTDLHPHHCQST